MTAEPDDTPVEPSIAPSAYGRASGQSPRPRPTVIDQPPEAQPASLSALLRPLAAGLVGGLLGAGILSLILSGGSPAPDEQVRLSIKELQDKIREQQDKTAQLSDTIRVKLAAPVKTASPDDLNEVRSRLDTLLKAAKAEDESVQSLSQKVQALEQKPVAQPEKAAVQAEIASQMAPVAERLAGLERSQSERASDARTAAAAIALTNLKRAVSDGKPFAAELTAIESLSSEKLPISQLAPYKDTGVPSLSQLQHEFADIVHDVIVKHYHGKAESFMDEVLSRARGAIQVTPTGGAGDTVEAVLGRMESALKAGDVKGALTESAGLEGPAKEELQTWLGHAQARATADEAVRKTDQELLASLTKTSATH